MFKSIIRQSCSEQGLNRILFEFERAANLLEESNITFIEMCNSRSDPRLNNSTAVEIPLQIKPKHKKNKNRFRNRAQNNNQNFRGNPNYQNAEFISFMHI